MSEELAYVIITPYSLHKSRTGGILSRLLTRTGLDLVGARMFAPTEEIVRRYAEQTISANDPQDRKIQELIYDYIIRNLSPDPKTGKRRRIMMLLLKGEDAVRKTRAVVGHISPDRRGGETIRDTYGDLITGDDGSVTYFEPAVLAPPTVEEAKSKVKIWAEFAEKEPTIAENVIAYAPGEKPQRTLVLIKPENFRFPTGRPGNMIDFFSRTGLYIVGVKILRMSVGQATEFYGPVREILRTKLKDVIAARAKAAIEKETEVRLDKETEKALGDVLGRPFGDHQFENIVRFMSGKAPSEVAPDQMNEPGSEKCIALVYEGVDAVKKIRDVLGPTDPSKAPPGSIRREFGSSVMVNAAHASDSPENAVREMKIIRMDENTFSKAVAQALR